VFRCRDALTSSSSSASGCLQAAPEAGKALVCRWWRGRGCACGTHQCPHNALSASHFSGLLLLLLPVVMVVVGVFLRLGLGLGALMWVGGPCRVWLPRWGQQLQCSTDDA
jgi:hypothetical protein